jgi:hypothetical protein
MALDNLKRTVLANRLQTALQKSLIYGNLANQNYTGDLVPGGTVKVAQIGEVAVNDYTAYTDMTYETLDDASLSMVIDQKKYFAFVLDETDERFISLDVTGAAIERGSYRIRDGIDQFIAGKYGEAGVKYGTAGSPKATSSGSVFQHLAEFGETMDEANIPREGRWAVVPPWIFTKLTIAASTNMQPNGSLWASGWIGGVAGFDRLYMSNNVQLTGTVYTILASAGNEAISYAGAIDGAIRMFPHEAQRGTKVDGLWVYGAKVVRPDMLAVMYSAETAN